MLRILFFVIILLLSTLITAQKIYPENTYVIVNARIVDISTQTISTGSILIHNGKIQGRGEIEIPDRAQVIDLNGAFIMAGMIDVHTHLDNLAAARRALMSGVTTVRSASVSAYQDVAISEMVYQGSLPGPDMIPCGVYVTPQLGETILADKRLAKLTGEVDDEQELRHLVRVNIDRGAKVIKTRGTERAGRPETDPRKQTYSTEQLEWIIDEASKADIPVMIHAHGDEGAYAAVAAGAKSIEHGTFLSEKTLRLMKETGAYLVPTYITLIDLIEPGGDYDDPVVHIRGKYMVPKSEWVIKKAMEIGVKIATGADNNYTPASTSRVSMEVEEFMRLGMPPWEALKTTTLNAAELLGIGDHTGQITKGYEADLIAIMDNPIENPKALQDVVLVMSNGNLVFNRLPFSKE